MNFRERDDMGANVIMVASGKGGTGKSTVAVLLGAELAARGRRVLLVGAGFRACAAWIISRAYTARLCTTWRTC